MLLRIGTFGSVAPRFTAPLRAAGEADPVDDVARTPAQERPPGGRWKTVSDDRLLGLGCFPGALGIALSHAVRQDVLAGVRRLQDNGVEFLHWNLPTTADKTLEMMEKTERNSRVLLRLPGEKNITGVASLEELKALDDYYNGPVTPLREAVDSLAAAGLVHSPADEYKTLVTRGVLWARVAERGPDASYSAKNADDVLAMDFFAGSGIDRGLAGPDRAAGLRAAAQAGLIPVWRAYHQYAFPRERFEVGGSARVPTMLARESDLADVEKLTRVCAEYSRAFAQHVLPVLPPEAALPPQFRYPDGPFTLEGRLHGFGLLLGAAGSAQKALKLYEKAVAQSQSALELVRVSEMLAGVCREQGLEAALSAADEVARAPAAASRDLKARLFDELLEVTGSHSAASAGVGLVRIPVGEERLEERVALFSRVASSLGEGYRDQTASLYQEILIHRAGSESLAEAGERFCVLLGACARLGHPLLAPAVFEQIQGGLDRGEVSGADLNARVRGFVSTAVVSGSLGEALHSLESVAPAGGIRLEGEYAVVGGVRVKLKSRK